MSPVSPLVAADSSPLPPCPPAPLQECNKGIHGSMYVPWGAISIFMFIIGLPATVLLMLGRQREHLQSSMAVMSVYGHMYLRYTPDKWWWESLLQVRTLQGCGGLQALPGHCPLDADAAVTVLGQLAL
jgi:hypothetical protein